MKNKIILALAASAFLAPAAFAQTADVVTAELTTAATHAGLAAKATDIKMVQMHLHHTLNCLEGPGGKDFDQGNANPCAKLGGKGAITDATPGQAAKLQVAVTSALDGVATTDLATAQKDASDTAATINAAK